MQTVTAMEHLMEQIRTLKIHAFTQQVLRQSLQMQSGVQLIAMVME
jgi:hypothetical protein